MKRLVLCLDGTWNRVDQMTDGKLCPTNVVKFAVRVANRDQQNNPQVLYYDQGVGTGNVLDKYSGGTFGKGLEDNIWDAYRFLIANYEHGDAIYIVGFSRGAFTARSIVGMVRKCGILNRLTADSYLEAIRLYRSQDHPDEPICQDFRERNAIGGCADSARVRMIGVWDTVGALGIPIRGLRSLTAGKYEFHDTELSNIVEHACHALAIDERRAPFEPTLWDPPLTRTAWQLLEKATGPEAIARVVEDGVKDVPARHPCEAVRPMDGRVSGTASAARQVVEQVWFAGVHTDIGGGYPESGLSDIALEWMIEKARTAGLEFNVAVLQRYGLHPSATGSKHNSKKGLYALTKGIDRVIGLTGKTAPVQNLPDFTQSVHPTVYTRWQADSRYRPPMLREYFRRTNDPILGVAP